MATYTTNYNLIKPEYGDTADIADINTNMEAIDTQMKANADAAAATVPISRGGTGQTTAAAARNSLYTQSITDMTKVVNGKQSTSSIAVGQFVQLINSTISGKDDGMYKAAKAISANTDIDGTYLTELSGGALNNMIDAVVDALYPVGSVYISFNSSMPSYLTSGRTWAAVSGGYVLKTVTSGTGGATTAAGNTGSHTLTVNEMPSHTHSYPSKHDGFLCHVTEGSAGHKSSTGSGSDYVNYKTPDNTGGGQGHTHTAGMPANVAVYMWKRTA